jgi:imidazolonepropionase-like amidohydrolase
LKTVLIAGGNVIDGTGSAPQAKTDVLLKGDRIVAVGKNLVIDAADRANAETIDASGLTVMPGLIDAHVHVTLGEPRTNDELFMHRDAATSAMLAAFNVRKVLKAGVTSMLDVDGIFNIGPALRDSINAGIVEGPTMRSGSYALMTAVGGTAGKLIPDSGTAGYAEVVRDKEEMVRVVRRQVKEGADIIKIHVTGSIPTRSGEIQVWTREELKVVCDTAHDLGVRVTAHCRGDKATLDAVMAGVDIIWHASFLGDAALEAIIDKKVPVGPVFTFLANLSESGFSMTPYGHWHAREMEVFVQHLGLTPLQAITCATKDNAVALDEDGETGCLASGYRADVLILDGDPSKNVSLLSDKSTFRHLFCRGKKVDLSPMPARSLFRGEQTSSWSEIALTREVALS